MNNASRIQVNIVDDNIFLAKAIEKKIVQSESNIDVCYISEGFRGILKQLDNGIIPDLILMDIEMPGIDGIALTGKIKSEYPSIKIIMLTVFDDEKRIFDAIKAGASGYLLKDVSADNLVRSIRETMQGGASMSPSIAFKVLKLMKTVEIEEENSSVVKPNISKREVEVLELLKTGKTYGKIADILGLSEGTIRKHIENIYKKLHAHNKVEAIEIAKKHKII